MQTVTMTRKNISIYSLLGVFLVFVWLLSDCSKEDKVVDVTNVTINAPPFTLKIGETKQLTATVTPADATDKTVKWSSLNETSCTIDQTGKVKAIAVGTATIKAKAGDKEASIQVTVIELPAPAIIWSPAGNTYSAQAGSAPFTKTATLSGVSGCNAVVTYSIDPASGVASINANTGEVTPASSITEPTVTATATATTSTVAGVCLSATASYTLTISRLPPNKVTLNTDPVDKTYGDVGFSVKQAGCANGSPTYSVSGAGLALDGSNLIINGANTNGATVSVTCTESAQYVSSTTSYLVKIAKKPLSLAFENPITTMVIGSDITTNTVKVTGLVGTDTPDAATGGIYYNSSDPGKATINSTGAVHAEAAGTTTITASCINPSNNYSAPANPASYPLTVTTSPVISWTTAPPDDRWVKEDDIAIAATVSGGSTLTYEALDPSSTTGTASTLASITGDATNGYKLHLLGAGRGSVKIRVKSSDPSIPSLEKTVVIKDWVASDFAAVNYEGVRQLFIDSNNNIYSSTSNYKILKVSSTGNVTTFAGTGTQGNSDGTSKENATFGAIQGIAMDNSGNIYVAEAYSVLRKISSDGKVSTIRAQTPNDYSQGVSGLQFDANGILYGTTGNTIVTIRLTDGAFTTYAGGESSGSDNGGKSTAKFASPGKYTIVSGNMYICDFGNALIRKIDMTDGGEVTRFSGVLQSGYTSNDGSRDTAQYGYLQGITADTAGNFFVIEGAYISSTNSYSGALRKIDAAGNVKTIVSTGISNAKSIVRDPSGNLYVSVGDSAATYKLIKFSYQ